MNKTSSLQQVLSTIKETVAENKLPIVIFDLDDTLFSTASRNLRIIHEFAADNIDQFPKFAKVASSLALADMGWDPEDALVKAGLEKDPSLKAFKEYWHATYFTDAYVALDLPLPGAVDYVNHCYESGGLIFYLTGRRVSGKGLTTGMEMGTSRALTTRGFPFWEGRCELTLKVDWEQKDETFKDHALARVRSLQGRVVATFDNEPKNAKMFLENYPDAQNFWLNTTWDPTDRDHPDPGLIKISDFTG